jgi:hypothetical protein
MDASAWTVISSLAGVVAAAAAVIALIPRTRGRKKISSANARPGLPAPGQRRSRLSRGESLLVGHSLFSPDGRTRFTLQDDGNVVVFVDGIGDICDTRTANIGRPKLLKLDDSGWLVLYDVEDNVLWRKGPGGDHLEVQDNSHVVLYPATGEAIWATDLFYKAGMFMHWIPPEARVRW